MKPVDSVKIQKIKSVREVTNDEIKNFEMDIIYEGALDKSLEGSEKL